MLLVMLLVECNLSQSKATVITTSNIRKVTKTLGNQRFQGFFVVWVPGFGPGAS